MHPLEVLRRPLVTEKSTALSAQAKYVFEVALGANKRQVKEAVERAFNVGVVKVNVMNMHAERRRAGRRLFYTSPWKKAVVTLKPGDKITLFEGV
ncbi:MAG: 50S ribosomal protein L23 [Chloroflexi bacterium]|nr:50S ribosomal protein L23 [Chloroflexota bacterium]